MVDSVHGGRDEERIQWSRQRRRKAQIRVRVERDRGCRQQVQSHGRRRQSQHGDQRHRDGRPEQDFQRVMTLRRRHVDLRIAMVNQVETPQQRNLVEEPVFPIPPKVQQQERQQQLCGERKVESRQRPRRLPLRKRINPDWYYNPGEKVADQEQTDIACPAPRNPNPLALDDANLFQQDKRKRGRQENE